MIPSLTKEERRAMTALLKGAWFFVATAGKFITTTSSYTPEAIKAADVVGEQFDKYLKEIA